MKVNETANHKHRTDAQMLFKRGSDDSMTRYCTVVRDRKEARHHGADSSMGGKM
ncbi:hypothetical protein DPMN_054132 [Dreissena polymorpha]|uniref:Uncharacterized protein n=1 Tax=Dreissena polymorpha TaxID=45954 RepID=A0A9D4CPR5_DREPO|nr:hypothetical protein DPMN_054132 [Dreissena polymorpha]